MTRFDLSPLMRSSIGFDHLNRLVDQALSADTSGGYPPYNIEKLSDDDYRITMAVAGFGEDELTITVQNGTLAVAGKAIESQEQGEFLHRGIANRAFERRFQLAETVEVGDAKLANGLLQIALKRVIPEHMRPKNISINGKRGKVTTIETDAA